MKALGKAVGRTTRPVAVTLGLAALAIATVMIVTLTARGSAQAHTVRTYYVAADLVAWNYAPSGANLVSGQPFGDQENVFVRNVPYSTNSRLAARIGSAYTKALYREYTDGTFTTLKPRAPRWQHLGFLGPVLQAEVGDTIVVHFKNNAGRPYSMHPHGVFYLKASEGAPYNDEDGANGGDAVAPGGVWTYNWVVPDRAGPGPADGSSVAWMYHSHVDETRDTYSGLIGPMIVYRAGGTRPDGQGGIIATDVDTEYFNMFLVANENLSWYVEPNIRAYADPNNRMRQSDVDALRDSDDFFESNLMHNINGYVYGNMPLADMTMRQGARVRWYLLGMGTEVDLHTPHWHGQTLLSIGMRTDVVELLPGSMKVADMTPDNPGVWLYHCHVNDHIDAGMITRFKVEPNR
jgi:manganese oxidase